MKISILVGIGVIVGFVIFTIYRDYQAVDDFEEMEVTEEDFQIMEKYPSPELLRTAIDNHEVSEEDLPEVVKFMYQKYYEKGGIVVANYSP